MDTGFVVGLLAGTDRETSAQFLLVALGLAGLALLVEAFLWFATELGIGEGAGGGTVLALVGLGAVLGAAANGYVNDGLLVSLLVGAAPMLGVAAFDLLLAPPARFPGLPASTCGATLAVGALGGLAGVVGVVAGRLMKGDRRLGTRP